MRWLLLQSGNYLSLQNNEEILLHPKLDFYVQGIVTQDSIIITVTIPKTGLSGLVSESPKISALPRSYRYGIKGIVTQEYIATSVPRTGIIGIVSQDLITTSIPRSGLLGLVSESLKIIAQPRKYSQGIKGIVTQNNLGALVDHEF